MVSRGHAVHVFINEQLSEHWATLRTMASRILRPMSLHGLDQGRRDLSWQKWTYKGGDSTWKLYEKRCNQLRNQDARGNDGQAVDKMRVAVKDLYSRIVVAIRSAESISKQIEKLRGEELQPQILELLQGLMGTWKRQAYGGIFSGVLPRIRSWRFFSRG